MKKFMVPLIAIILFFAVAYAVTPLLGKSYIPTHDGEYHIIRIVEFAKMLSAGYLFPRWAPDMNSGYGIPIFNYHYPLPNYIGSFMRVFTRDAVLAFQQSMALGYIVLAVGAYAWLSSFFGVFPGLVGATVSVFVPYLFVDMYVRGSIGELWGTAFLFVTLSLIEKKRYPWFAAGVALLILSHNILAMLYVPFLLVYILLRDKRTLTWMLGGIGLAAYFWAPALLESKYVQGLNTVNFRDHFVQIYELIIPSWGTQFSGTGSFGNQMSFQIGIAPLIAIAGALWMSAKERNKSFLRLCLYMFAVLAICVLLMLPISLRVWEIVSPLQLIQYPWRLLSFVIPISGFFAAYWVSRMKHRWWGVAISVMAIFLAYTYAQPVRYAPRSEAYYLSRLNFTDGTSSLGNSFSTIWTGWKVKRPDFPYPASGSYLDRNYQIQIEESRDVALPILYFPGWRVSIDQKDTPVDYQKDGVVHVVVPAGMHLVRAYFTETPIRQGSDVVSLVSLVILSAYAILAL